MANRPLSFQKVRDETDHNLSSIRFSRESGDDQITEGLTVRDIDAQARAWVEDGQYRMLSKQTLANRRRLLDKFLWFLRTHEEMGERGIVDKRVVKRFLTHLTIGHEEEGGRWGIPDHPLTMRPIRPATAATYYRNLCTFWNFMVQEEVVETSVFSKMKGPVNRQDQINPFSRDQVQGLLAAAHRTRHALRDEALILFLLDTGARAGETTGLLLRDLNLTEGWAQVLGKGNKKRKLRLSPPVKRALGAYLRAAGRSEEQPVFISEGGHDAGEGLTVNGLRQIFYRLGALAGIAGARCSPHTFRHTFAVEFLRHGGSQFTLMEMLGHTHLAMTKRYVALAEADIAEQHRQHSPVQAMLKRRD